MRPSLSVTFLLCLFYLTAIALTLSVNTVDAQRNQSSSSARYKTKCPEAKQVELDQCASRMGFLGNHDFRVPKDANGMRQYCSDLSQAISCIQTYSRDCLAGFTRQLLTSLLKRGKQQYQLMCNTNEYKADFIKKMSCLADDKIEKFHNTMDGSIARFEYIASKAIKSDARLPMLCCSYQIFNRDVEQTLNEICGKPARRQGSINEYVQKLVGGTAGEFFGLICESHRSLDDCKASKKTSAHLDKLEDITKQVRTGKLSPKSKSLIPVLLEILDSAEA